MAVLKRSVSLDDTVARRVEAAAEEEGTSFSAWLSEAAEHQLRRRDGLQAVAEWEAAHGRLTPEELAAGRALLDRLTDQRAAGAA